MVRTIINHPKSCDNNYHSTQFSIGQGLVPSSVAFHLLTTDIYYFLSSYTPLFYSLHSNKTHPTTHTRTKWKCFGKWQVHTIWFVYYNFLSTGDYEEFNSEVEPISVHTQQKETGGGTYIGVLIQVGYLFLFVF